MNDRYKVCFTENEVSEMTDDHISRTKEFYKTSERFADFVSFLPPPKIFKKLARLIHDEGVNPSDIDVVMINENQEEFVLHLGLDVRYKTVYTDPLSA